MKTILRFISTIIAVSMLMAIIFGLGILLINPPMNTAIFYTLIGLCFTAGIAGAICEQIERI
jgi:hypothetical protein